MRLLAVTFALLFVSQVFAEEQQDANACPMYPTCELCIQHNPCGWCSVPVVYSDGSTGPRCAGKPRNPNNPPPGYKPWTCPLDYQNSVCYGYVCSPTFTCVSSGAPGAGVPLAQCLQQCFPPTYDCNHTTHQCYKTVPGNGTDLPDCQTQCNASATTGGTTTDHSTTGQSSGGGKPSPATPGYECDSNSLSCKQAQSGGIPEQECEQICGKPSNNTPVFALGDYRGIEISMGYVKGEWQARIGQDSAVIVDPSRAVWAKGVVRVYNNELWMVTDQGINRGLYGLSDLPEVAVLTWALGGVGKSLPASYDAAMKSGSVFVFAKCLNPNNCKFNILQIVRSLFKNKFRESAISDNLKRDLDQVVNDPCMQYPDCHTCITAPQQCGWCSVPVLYYNGSVVGKQCAGVNTTVSPKINCTGSFTTQDCSIFTTTGTSVATGQSTGGPPANDKYKCNPATFMCEKANDGQPKADCDKQCNNVPVVPPVLQNTIWRGLEIDERYIGGEWRVVFSTTGVDITDPAGTQTTGKISQVERYLTITTSSGQAIQTLWQISQGPSSQFLAWAWGVPGADAPQSFDSAMTTTGNTEYFFAGCLPGKDKSVCDFSN